MKRRSREIMLLPLLVLALSGIVQTTEESSYKTTLDITEPELKHDIDTIIPSKNTIKIIPNIILDASPKIDDINFKKYSQILANPKKLLDQEIDRLNNTNNQLNDDAATEKKIKKIFVNIAEPSKKKDILERYGIVGEPQDLMFTGKNKNKPINNELKSELDELVNDEIYTEDDEDEDDDDDDLDDDEDDDNDNDDDDEDQENEKVDDSIPDNGDDVDDEEEVMAQCPDYCKCTKPYTSSTTAICSKLSDHKKTFGLGINHLKIQNAGDLVLDKHALSDRGLQQLETLTIVNTRISVLDRTAFDGIPFLNSIQLSRNGLIDIHPNTFENNSQLRHLEISGHPYWHNWTVNKEYLLNIPNLEELLFSWNEVPHLPSSAFIKMPKLTYLNLQANRLGKIDKKLFEPLKFLIELDLSSNMLSSIPSDTFEGIHLQTLKIGDNFIQTLDTINASRLTILDASSNHILLLKQNDLVNIPLLQHFIISRNKLQGIHDHAFSHLLDLEHLDISGNNLTMLSDHLLRNNARLQTLLINDNPNLKKIPKFFLKGMERNQFSIFRFECENCGLNRIEKGTFDSMPALSQLNLARNYLIGLPDGLLSLSSLKEIDLSDNAISHIPENMFDGAISLTIINLASNPLRSLQVTPFLKTKGLLYLDVSNCQLKRVWSEARTRLRSLRFLSLRGNQLEHLLVEELKATPKLSGLDLGNNKLICDSDFTDSFQWLMKHGIDPILKSQYVVNLREEKPSDFEGMNREDWFVLYGKICGTDNDDGPPLRKKPQPPIQHKTSIPIYSEDVDHSELSRNDIEKNIDTVIHVEQTIDDENTDNWPIQDIPDEDEIDCIGDCDNLTAKSIYRSWYGGPMWPLLVAMLVAGAALLIIIQTAHYMKQRRGHSPVLRGLHLYPSLDTNKNSGAVYKQLQEEIPTPKMTKKGGFFLISPWTTNDVIPESV